MSLRVPIFQQFINWFFGYPFWIIVIICIIVKIIDKMQADSTSKVSVATTEHQNIDTAEWKKEGYKTGNDFIEDLAHIQGTFFCEVYLKDNSSAVWANLIFPYSGDHFRLLKRELDEEKSQIIRKEMTVVANGETALSREEADRQRRECYVKATEKLYSGVYKNYAPKTMEIASPFDYAQSRGQEVVFEELAPILIPRRGISEVECKNCCIEQMKWLISEIEKRVPEVDVRPQGLYEYRIESWKL